jgi:hypothetical protein
MEAEVREIPESAICAQGRVKLGSLLAITVHFTVK